MARLPKRTKSQEIGISVAELFNSVFTRFCNVIPVPQECDLGIDVICELMQEEHPTGKLFNVQCKGREELEVKGDQISIQISVTTLNYWLLQKNPTFLVIVDYQNHEIYWTFPKDFLSSLNKDWQIQKKVAIPIPIHNRFSQDASDLPSNLILVVDSQALAPPQHGDYLGTLTLQFDRSSSTEQMSIKGLMHYYLEGSQIANVRWAYGSPGSSTKVYPEIFGGEGYGTEIEARVWGDLKGESAILLQMPGERNYVLSYRTFQEICYLLSLNLSNCETYRNLTSRGGYPGGNISVMLEGQSISAKVWYELPPGKLSLNIFNVQGRWYAISLVGSKLISSERQERRTGTYLNHDPRRAIA
jgi:hypothetical protein